MKNRNVIIAILLFQIFTAQAQNLTDIVRWSTQEASGTARTLGVGSAFGAMGGDFSGININPASIATYKVSEFMFTPSMNSSKTDAFFQSDPTNNQTNKRSNLSIDNIGFVVASNPGTSWTSSNVAIGFSRVSNLTRNIRVSGVTKGSITTMFAELANGNTEDQLDDFVAYPAYNVGAIYDFDMDNFYNTDFANPEELVYKLQTITQKGGINEFTLGWAGEYQHKMNLGISLAVPFASFEEVKNYEESDETDQIPTFNSLSYTERLSTSGVGFNLKMGFVYKITPKLRIGGAFHSPTWYKFTDDYSTDVSYTFTDGFAQSYSYTSPDGTFDYNISNPWRAVGSIGTTYRVGSLVGFVDADVEFVDYSTATYNGKGDDSNYTQEINDQIVNKLGTATNIRLGTELGYQTLRLRLGYSWERSPFNADTFYNNKFSFGIGYRQDKFFIDLGVRMYEQQEGYNPYIVLDSKLDPLAVITTNRMKSALTLGFKF